MPGGEGLKRVTNGLKTPDEELTGTTGGEGVRGGTTSSPAGAGAGRGIGAGATGAQAQEQQETRGQAGPPPSVASLRFVTSFHHYSMR